MPFRAAAFPGPVSSLAWLLLHGSLALELKLGFLYKQGGVSWMQESWSQFKLAIQDVNADPALLPQHVLNYTLADSEGLELRALQGARDLLADGVVGIVGTGYSSALAAPSVFCSMMAKPIVSPGSTAVDLVDKTRYPFLLRSIVSDGGQLKAMVVVSYELGWRRAAVLVNADLEKGYSAVLMGAMQSFGLQHLFLSYRTPDSIGLKQRLAGVLQMISTSGYRIIMLYPKGVDMAEMDVLSKSKGLRSSSYWWFMTNGGYELKEWQASTNVVVVQLQNLGTNALKTAFQARWPNVATIYNETKHGKFNKVSKLPFYGTAAYSSTIWDTDYAPVGNGEPDYWGTFVYDTVFLFAKALHAMDESGENFTDGATLRDRLLKLHHAGITGNVTFDRETQDRTLPMEIILSRGTGRTPYVIAKTTEKLGASSGRRLATNSWCRSGCTDLTAATLAAIPWPSGQAPTDGRALDPDQSQVFGARDFFGGSPIQVDIKASDGFGNPPCADTCAGNRSAPDCHGCSQSLAAYDQLTVLARDAAGTLLQPTTSWQRKVNDTLGSVRLVLPTGFGNNLGEDYKVYITILHRSRPLKGSPHEVLIKVPPEEDDSELLVILLSVVGSLLVLTLVVFAVYRTRKYLIEKAKARERNKRMVDEYKHMVEERIDRACAATKTCMFNVCFIKYTNFKKAGKLLQHEHHREEGNLVSFDTYRQVYDWVADHATMFVSHQWLGFTQPDPDNIHFPAICYACENLCAKFDLAEDELYCWVDYVSIPQANPHLKMLSIASLAVYASVVKYFVIVAPKCIHHDKKEECNSETYQRRGWCRLEQWARMTIGGLDNMYLYEEDGTMQSLVDKPNWYTMSIKVFEGDFTVDADKENLVDPIMGLWYMSLLNENNEILKKLVEEHKEAVFPAEYFKDFIQPVEDRVHKELQRVSVQGHSSLINTQNQAHSAPNVEEEEFEEEEQEEEEDASGPEDEGVAASETKKVQLSIGMETSGPPLLPPLLADHGKRDHI